MIEAWPDTRDNPVERPCGRLPILDQFEDGELAGIDASEWYLPSADEGRRLAQAGDRLGVYLMAYRVRQEAAAGRGLCNRIVPARLDPSALDEVLEIETAIADVAIVAYERPLRRR
ncbi:hypothetical protein LJR220_002613 [Bradyrhizobium sp. LjRoot220]|uniref:hypothetical protein n=1 Tax=Bradyrhizobium sp. LjRoot220 TaxID=3342284 RepID=UPI003ECE6CA9